VQGREKMLGSPSISGGAMAMKIEHALGALPRTGAPLRSALRGER
jgi:hypothetical protein